MKCKYCGEPAGFFKTIHPECKKAAENGQNYIRECIDYIYAHRDCMNIAEVIDDTVKRYHIPQKIVKPLLLECWNAKVVDALADGVVSDDEIKILREMLLPFGISRKEIEECEEGKKLLAYGQTSIRRILNQAMQTRSLATMNADVSNVATAYGFDQATVKHNVIACWKEFLDDSFNDGILDEDIEQLLTRVSDLFDFDEHDIGEYHEKIVKGAVLRDVLNGITRCRLNITNQTPIMLQKNEVILWLFNNTAAYEDKTRRYYTGGSAGVSFRVAKGVYLRTGAFKGYPVETTETVCLGHFGCFIVTNKHVFWISSAKSIKIPVKKIISVMPCSNGVIIQKDGVTAKSQTFVTSDPWFTYNLISNLNLVQ